MLPLRQCNNRLMLMCAAQESVCSHACSSSRSRSPWSGRPLPSPGAWSPSTAVSSCATRRHSLLCSLQTSGSANSSVCVFVCVCTYFHLHKGERPRPAPGSRPPSGSLSPPRRTASGRRGESRETRRRSQPGCVDRFDQSRRSEHTLQHTHETCLFIAT